MSHWADKAGPRSLRVRARSLFILDPLTCIPERAVRGRPPGCRILECPQKNSRDRPHGYNSPSYIPVSGSEDSPTIPRVHGKAREAMRTLLSRFPSANGSGLLESCTRKGQTTRIPQIVVADFRPHAGHFSGVSHLPRERESVSYFSVHHAVHEQAVSSERSAHKQLCRTLSHLVHVSYFFVSRRMLCGCTRMHALVRKTQA